MPVTIAEQHEQTGPRVETPDYVERNYWATGATSSDNALALVFAYVPATITTTLGTYYLSQRDSGSKEVEKGVWSVTCVWKINVLDDTSFETSFDISGETQRITQSYQRRSHQAASGFTLGNFDFAGAINVDESGNINGADIIVPKTIESAGWERTSVDDTYKTTLTRMVGKINNGTYMGYQAGELLLVGVSGSRSNYGKWKMSARFCVSANWSSVVVGPFTVSKKGWDYFWVHYVTIEHPTTKKSTKKPAYAAIEQVYLEGDFSTLAIPGT